MNHQLIGPFPDGVDPEEYDRARRRVLWSFPTGLFVVGTTAELEGQRRYNLMTANLVMQVAIRPKLLALAVETESLTARLVASGRCFSVCVLHRADRSVVRHFVKPLSDVVYDQQGAPLTMAAEPVTTALTGAPILAKSAAWVDCRLFESHELGSHLLAIGEVVDAGGLDAQEMPEILRMEDTRMNYGG